MMRRVTFVVFATLVSLTAPNASAVIRVDSRITKIYDLSNLVLIGQVARANAKEKVIEVKVVKVPKGNFSDEKIQIKFTAVGDSFPAAALNEPVVIFSGLKSAVVHVADTFLTAEAITQTPVPKLEIKKTNAIPSSYPGRTAGLVRLVDDIASGHPTLLNAIQHDVWRGGIIERGNVLPQSDYLIAPDLAGKGRADVVIGNSHSTQVLVDTGNGLRDQTQKWGLGRAKGKWAAYGHVTGDKRIDLLIGNQLWLNRGDHFDAGPILALPNDNDILAVALLDRTGNGRPDAVFLNKSGEIYVFENPGVESGQWSMLPPRRLWNDGEDADAAVFSNDWGDTGRPDVMVTRATGLIRYALAPDGGPPADFERLTGQPLKAYNEIAGTPHWEVIAVVPLDINGDGRKDFIVILDKGGPTLVNRGFGAFLLNPLPTEALHSSYRTAVPWGEITSNTRFCAGDLHGEKFDDLLIATPEGKLFELHNTPYKPPLNAYQ